MKLLLLLFGLILVLEGLPYAVNPASMQEWLKKVSDLPPSQLRLMGSIAVAVGLCLLFLLQRTSILF